MPTKKPLKQQPALAPQFFRVSEKGPDGKVQRINLAYVVRIDSGTQLGNSRRIVFLTMYDGTEIPVGHADEIENLAQFLETTTEDLLK